MKRHLALLSAVAAAAAAAIPVLLVLSGPAADQALVLPPSEPSIGHHTPAVPSSSVAPPAAGDSPVRSHLGAPGRPGRGNQQTCVGTPESLGEAEGALPSDATVFDDMYPGIANLDRDLLQTLREAADDAADEGVEFQVNSGWRSKEYQERLLCEAVSEYGSKDEAAEWVASPAASFHVSGEAVDMGSAARTWLSDHGARFGLCQIYRNEPWHYELRPDAIQQGCPPMYATPEDDPRMQR